VDTVSCELEACDRSLGVECFRLMQSLFLPHVAAVWSAIGDGKSNVGLSMPP